MKRNWTNKRFIVVALTALTCLAVVAGGFANDEDKDSAGEEPDEEMDEGTDYANNYFDNGEDYANDEDDNLDEGGIY